MRLKAQVMSPQPGQGDAETQTPPLRRHDVSRLGWHGVSRPGWPRLLAAGIVMLAALGMAACTSGPSASPTASSSMLTAPSPVSSTIPTPSPTPSWSAEGLAAIKAVQTSLETWDRLANNLTTADLNEIQLVELPPQSNNSLNQLAHWRSQGYSYQGWTEFTPTRVEYLGPDPWPGGDSWRVYGCYNISNAWVYNPDGSIHATGRIEESLSRFEVAAFTDNNGKQQWQVYDNSINEGSC